MLEGDCLRILDDDNIPISMSGEMVAFEGLMSVDPHKGYFKRIRKV